MAEPMTFRSATSGGNCASCNWIVAQGEIQSDTAKRLEDYLRREGINYQATVALHSPGGDLAAGIALGELIRARRLTTSVTRTVFRSATQPDYDDEQPGVCASACALAFLGGVQRHMPKESRLGLHQFASTDGAASEGDTQRTVALVAAYLARMDVSLDLILPMGLVDPSAMYWLQRREAERLNVVTDRERTAEAEWRLAEFSGAVSIEAFQVRSDGAEASYRMICGQDAGRYWLLLSLRVAGRTPAEVKSIASSIAGASLQTGGAKLGQPLAVEAVGIGEAVVVGLKPSRGMISALAEAPEPVELSLDMPRMAAEFVGGWFQPIPRSNLRTLLPILDRNC